jgi:chorismate mutase-like protein
MAPPPGIPQLREAIDSIDRQLVELLARRLELVMKVGEIKRAHDLPVYDADRERDLLERVARAAPRPLAPDVAQRIMECIIQESRSLEQRHVSGLTDSDE